MKTFGWFSELYDQAKDTFEFKLRTLEFEIIKKILSLMRKKNMSRTDLAGKLGTSKASISKLLNDGSNLTIKRMLKISDALGCEVKIEIVPVESIQDAIGTRKEASPGIISVEEAIVKRTRAKKARGTGTN